MKLTILKENFKKGLNITERVISKSLTLPILNNILLSAEKNFFKLTATDLEIATNWWTLTKVEEEGKIVIPAKILGNFLTFLPDKPVSLETKDNILHIEAGNYRAQIKGFDPEDFPIIPQVSTQEFIEIPSSIFCHGLSQVVDFTLPSQAKPEISGIYFVFQKNLIKITATDSFRLGERKLYLDKTVASADFSDKEISFILPQKTAREIINIFSEEGADLKIYFSPNQILFETLMEETAHPKIHLFSKLVEGDYPNYQEIIPKKFDTQVVLEGNEFLNQIKSASLFSGRINEVKLKINPKKGGVEISSQNPDLGEHQGFLPAKIKGEELEISFNYRFLAEGLLNMKNQEVIFELNKEEGPGVLKPAADASYIYLVMPVKAS